MEALDNGKSIRETRDCDIPIVARHFYHHAGWAQLMESEMKGWKSLGNIIFYLLLSILFSTIMHPINPLYLNYYVFTTDDKIS